MWLIIKLYCSLACLDGLAHLRLVRDHAAYAQWPGGARHITHTRRWPRENRKTICNGQRFGDWKGGLEWKIEMIIALAPPTPRKKK